jgi:hypothetical protein
MFTHKQLIQMIAAPAMLGLIMVAPAQAATVMDNYIGSNDHGYGDVIGSAADFNIISMNVTMSGTMLNVSINTNFAGKGDNRLFASDTYSGNGIGYGDLFLSTSWNPFGTATDSYSGDNANNGTVWNYGFALDNRYMNEASAGTGTLYSLNSGSNATDTLLSNSFIDGSRAIYRDGQAVAVNTASAGVSSFNSGTWDINTATNTVNFQLDLAGTGLLGSNIGVRWGMTCANDAIEGSVSTVPVPAAAWLFGSGLLGLVGVARRRKIS